MVLLSCSWEGLKSKTKRDSVRETERDDGWQDVFQNQLGVMGRGVTRAPQRCRITQEVLCGWGIHKVRTQTALRTGWRSAAHHFLTWIIAVKRVRIMEK